MPGVPFVVGGPSYSMKRGLPSPSDHVRRKTSRSRHSWRVRSSNSGKLTLLDNRLKHALLPAGSGPAQ